MIGGFFVKKRAWFLVIIIICSIFYLSSIPGLRVVPVLKQFNFILSRFDISVTRLSSWLASRLPLETGTLGPVKVIGNDFYSYARENPIIIEFFLRKLAHVLVFFIITLAFFMLYNQYIKKQWIAVVLTMISGSIAAILDEYRQSFVPNRVGSIMDVFIDMIGVTIAVIFIVFALFITKREVAKINNKTNN